MARSQAYLTAYRAASSAAERMTDGELLRAYEAAYDEYHNGSGSDRAHGRYRAFHGEVDHRDCWA